MNRTFVKPPCLVLAGGQSRRMGGGAKFLETLGGETILVRILRTIAPQVGDILLNSNMDPDLFDDLDWPVAADVIAGFAGPLAGILTGLEYFAPRTSASHMLSLPSDAPFIPDDLVTRLQSAINEAPEETIVMAESVGRVHPVIALWPIRLAGDLRAALVDEDLRKILVFADRYRLKKVVWSENEGDPFFNINRPEDLELARNRI